MLMLSLRLTKARMAVGGAALVLALALCITGVRLATGQERAVSAVPVGEQTPAKAKKVSGKTNEDRLVFIQSYGWEVEAEAAEVIEVVIPKEFDEVYTAYNSIQKMQGFNLESYAGKRCKRYSYTVTNYPGTDAAVRINLLVAGDKIVGGDVCSMEADGFMHGFTPEA